MIPEDKVLSADLDADGWLFSHLVMGHLMHEDGWLPVSGQSHTRQRYCLHISAAPNALHCLRRAATCLLDGSVAKRLLGKHAKSTLSGEMSRSCSQIPCLPVRLPPNHLQSLYNPQRPNELAASLPMAVRRFCVARRLSLGHPAFFASARYEECCQIVHVDLILVFGIYI